MRFLSRLSKPHYLGLGILLVALLGVGTVFGVGYDRTSNSQRTSNSEAPYVLSKRDRDVRKIAAQYCSSASIIMSDNNLSSPWQSPFETEYVVINPVKGIRHIDPNMWAKTWGGPYSRTPEMHSRWVGSSSNHPDISQKQLVVTDAIAGNLGSDCPEEVAVATDINLELMSLILATNKGEVIAHDFDYTGDFKGTQYAEALIEGRPIESNVILDATDLTGDNKPEIIVRFKDSNSVYIFRREGETFVRPDYFDGNVIIEDIDGNGLHNVVSSWRSFSKGFDVPVTNASFKPRTLYIRNNEWQITPDGTFFARKEYIPEDFKVARTLEFLLDNPNDREIRNMIANGNIKTAEQLDKVLDATESALRLNVDGHTIRNRPSAVTKAYELVSKFERGRADILQSLISPQPEQAIEKAEQVLGTKDVRVIDVALEQAAKDLYVVDLETDEAKPFWSYMADVTMKRDELGVRIGVEPVAAYALAKLFKVGDIPLPWANNEELALVLAKNIAKEPGNSYVTISLRRDEKGELRPGVEFEAGERLVRVNDTVQAYLMDKEPELDTLGYSIQGIDTRDVLQSWEEKGREISEKSTRNIQETLGGLTEDAKNQLCTTFPNLCK